MTWHKWQYVVHLDNNDHSGEMTQTIRHLASYHKHKSTSSLRWSSSVMPKLQTRSRSSRPLGMR
jgi:hypothetical protein